MPQLFGFDTINGKTVQSNLPIKNSAGLVVNWLLTFTTGDTYIISLEKTPDNVTGALQSQLTTKKEIFSLNGENNEP